MSGIAAIAIAGTSGSVLVIDEHGQPLMFADARASEEAALIARVAPPDGAAHGATSSLAKFLWLRKRLAAARSRHVLHQADWMMGRLLGRFGSSDENSCPKLGYDARVRRWPEWLHALAIDPRLPTDIQIVTGTTDSVAGFIATGAARVGEAATSLGSTLAVKVISEQPVCAPQHGVYSHRLGNLWLAGGASNSGGAVLRGFFRKLNWMR